MSLGTSSPRESEGLFRLVADRLPLLVWTSGSDKRCTYFNKPWLDFTGRPLESGIGDGWTEGVHAADLPALAGRVLSRLRPSRTVHGGISASAA